MKQTSQRTLLRFAVAAVLISFMASSLAHAWVGFDALEHTRLLPPCLFRAATGVECPGCGMTRSLILLSQLRLAEATRLHPGGPLVLAAMVAYLALRPDALRSKWTARAGRYAAPAALVALAGWWLARGPF